MHADNLDWTDTGNSGPASGSGVADPPFANRGGVPCDIWRLDGECLAAGRELRPWSESVDWLSLTLPSASAADLLALTGLREDGYGGRGFRRSEQRDCPDGGWCWRRWEPWSESKAHGRDYECWEWASAVADDALEWLPSDLDARCTRLDVAFDFAVDRFRADDLAAWIRPHCESNRLTMGISGHAGVNTHYVGSPRSDRRIRIYRRDLKSIMEWAISHPDAMIMGDYGPQWCVAVLRVEVMLRRDVADAVWQMLRCDREAAIAAARGHLREMTGLAIERCGGVPQIASKAASEGEQMIIEWLHQQGDMIEACRRAGVDIYAASRYRWSIRERCRKREYRLRRRVEALAEVTQSGLRRLLASRYRRTV